jgi:pimeloyl-ACP methyl ester carboxylesterase
MDDVALVLDSVGSQRTACFGTDLGGRLALLFAATYPERTAAWWPLRPIRPACATRTFPAARRPAVVAERPGHPQTAARGPDASVLRSLGPWGGR